MKRRSAGLSVAAADRLRHQLDRFLQSWRPERRIGFDPIELPHRYSDPHDIEVSALLSTALAYGRVDLFKPKVEDLLAQMGTSPARFVADLDVARAAELLHGFVYRFNVAADLAVLLLGMGRVLREHGGLEPAFARPLEQTGSLHAALDAFTGALREAPLREIQTSLGRVRGLAHLLPHPLGPGAAKRLNLFLRWMVRGPDRVDFGLWRSVSASALMIPLDTHIHRVSRNLGLTRRSDLSWRTAEEITAGLRRLDPVDPVRYDFALCHYGMSGACPVRPAAASCERCALLGSCKLGPGVLRRAAKAKQIPDESSFTV